ncbi:hypothetical protein [Shewanella sp.]|uniref:hypothetical protein n=1 Tax=Shewanella sp. TaxID=50422 RepID=UPI004054810D
MPRIPQHERNMLNYIDQQLTAEIAVWRIVKSGWFDKVKVLKKAFDSALDMKEISIDLLIKGEDEHRLEIDLFDLLNQRNSGNEYEYEGYRRRFFQNYSKEHEMTFDYIFEMTRDERSALPKLDQPWITILNKGEDYPFENLKTYIDWLWYRVISDASFTPNLSKTMNDEQKKYWNCSESILGDKVEPEIARNVIKDWNDITAGNLALGSCIEGFYFDGDKMTTVIEGKTMQGCHIVALPKQIDEAMFDTTLEYVKSYLFKKQIPIETIRDIYTHYLPINIRTKTYKRQVIKNKSMVSMLFVGLFCDRLYETKIVKWKRTHSKNTKIETLHDAAECVAEFFSDIGFQYETESVVNARKKLLKIINELDVNH